MTTTFSEQDIELLGYVNPQREDVQSGAPWVRFGATAPAGLETIETSFLYLKSDCTIEDARRGAATIMPDRRAYVIIPRSLRISQDRLRSIFGKDTKIYIHEDLIWRRIHNIFAEYIASLRDGIVTERYYVSPRSTEDSIGDKLANVILDYLTRKTSSDDGKFLVICANAGVGKTTLTRYLVTSLAKGVEKGRTIPVYVEASHWGKLHLESVDELWEIIDNSLRTFSHNLRIREDLFQHALREGYISFIFDGFDELCGHKASHFVPAAVLERLAGIVRESSARLMITTRTLYWQSEIKKCPDNVRIETIDYFNTQQAKGYFRKFFSIDKKKLSAANQQYRELVAGSFRPREHGGARAQFVNLPLCVAMIAEHVRQGGERISAVGTRQLLENVLLQICEREVQRKNLRTKAMDQLRAFQEVAISEEGATNPEFELAMLEAAGMSGADVGKLIDHPLLSLAPEGRYRFSYDFLAPYLRALYIADVVARKDMAPSSSVWGLMTEEANGKGFMLEHLVSLLERDALEAVGQLVKRVPPNTREAESFLVHLAQSLVRLDRNVLTGQDRSRVLFSTICGNGFDKTRIVEGIYVTGPLEGLDLCGLRFRRCGFHDVIFRNCRADSSTVFENCTFSGELEFQPRAEKKDGWHVVRLVDCNVAFPANVIWDDVLGRDVTSREELVKDALRLGLGKFWQNGRLKTSLRRDDWNKGLLGHSGLCKPMLDAMLKTGIVEEIHISGVQEGGLAFDKSSLSDLQKFMDNQQMTGRILEVYRMLVGSV
jgi:hypothetical protein